MPRIPHLDLAKGFTVFIMPSVHSVMLYSNPSVQQSLLGDILAFLAEGPGAQLLMLLMGVSFSLSKKTNGRQVFKRTMWLLAGGFALNLFKFVLPIQLGLLPDELISDIPFADPRSPEISFFLMGDIFHFAAIAYPMLWLISKLKHYRIWAIIIAIAIMLLSPLVWDVKQGNIFVDQLLVYFSGHPPEVFFPAFPWLVYPLTGLVLGASVQSKKLLPCGIALLILSICFPATLSIPDYPSHYRTRFADTLFHLGIVLSWLGLINKIPVRFNTNPVAKILIFCSKHITLYYVIQWVLVFWFVPVASYLQLGFYSSLAWMAGMTIATLLITKLLVHAQSKGI